MRVYIGYDKDEDEAYKVAEYTLQKTSRVTPQPLNIEKLRAQGLYWRASDDRGQKYDLVSNAPCSTDFACSRFLVPILCQSGWALFTDCDVIFSQDITQLFLQHADPRYAVCVVHHDHHGEGLKMGGMVQTAYPRKNWSSVMLFNCDHPANRRLTLHDVNSRPGRDLHGFYWLHDDEIGELAPEWNWLVNVQDEPERPGICHFTEGGPWIPNWEPAEHDGLWLRERDEFRFWSNNTRAAIN